MSSSPVIFGQCQPSWPPQDVQQLGLDRPQCETYMSFLKVIFKTHLPCVLVLFMTPRCCQFVSTKLMHIWAWTPSAMTTSLCRSSGKWHIHICLQRTKHHALIRYNPGHLLVDWINHSERRSQWGTRGSVQLADPWSIHREQGQEPVRGVDTNLHK